MVSNWGASIALFLELTPQAKIYDQERILSKLLYKTRTTCSSVNITSSVPTEIITRIAMEVRLTNLWQFYDLPSMISMSHVCKSWHEAVISYPLLWNATHDADDESGRSHECASTGRNRRLSLYLFPTSTGGPAIRYVWSALTPAVSKS